MGIVMSKKEILRRLNTLRINPLGLKPRNYGISIKYYSYDEKVPSKRIDYEATADLNLEYNKGVLTINKKNIFYNQHQPDNISEILADSISKALYPIQTHLNEKGIGTNEITNLEEIKERWKDEKSKLSQKYSSKPLTDLFTSVDHKIDNKTDLEKSLQYDWFWNLFFHSKFIDYGETRKAKTALFLSVIPYQFPIRFSGLQTINKIPTGYHSFVIEFKSEEMPADPYFIPKNHPDPSSYFMSLHVIFDLDLYHHFPMHTRAYFEVFTNDSLGNKTLVKKINYTQFQLNNEDYKHKELSKESPFITGGLVISEPNKWGFYKNIYENDW
ncbi:hypothetical protein [Chryseobacterium sp. ISL-6]|uniref:hypothetical protein n=1 Tax=Chryseobacterium sp. ISL-6 TaxID=2819143 RepID=UPI001BE7D32D|nr:hypothetical protein [Chryseobacterium sp. ISL-6]MBT2621524.1 hypothetical protein [Chryseobacterium sp. ISL-6]